MKRNILMVFLILSLLSTTGCFGSKPPVSSTCSIYGTIVVKNNDNNKSLSLGTMSILGTSVETGPNVKATGSSYLEGAKVEISGPTNATVYTDQNGYFRVNNLSSGSYTVVITHKYYQSIAFSTHLSPGDSYNISKLYLGIRYSLSIGINNYAHINNLNKCVDDAIDFSSALKNRNTYPVKSKLLTDAQATKEGIRQAINSIVSVAQPQDVFVFYYSGHGAVKNDSTSEYIIPQNATNQDYHSYISDTEFAEWIKNLKCINCVFIFDCCYADGMVKSIGSKMIQSADMIMSKNLSTITDKNIVVLSSSQKSEVSYESKDRNSAFTMFLLKSMDRFSGADENNDNVLSAFEAFDYASRKSRKYLEDLNQQHIPTPQFYQNNNTGGIGLYMFD